MTLKVIKDGKVVTKQTKSPTERELDELRAKIARNEIYIQDLQNQIKDLKKTSWFR